MLKKLGQEGEERIKAGSNTQKIEPLDDVNIYYFYIKGRMELHSRLLNISQMTVLPQKVGKK